MTIKRGFGLLLLLAALGCATTPTPAHGGGHKFGSVGTSRGCMASLNTITGNNATIVALDSSTDTTAKLLMNGGAERFVVSMFFDQAVTVKYQVRARGSSTFRTVNGDGDGDSIDASTFTAIDFRIMGQDNRIQVVTGATGPTVAEMDICPTYDTPASL